MRKPVFRRSLTGTSFLSSSTSVSVASPMPHPASGCSVLPFANPAHSKNCWHPRLPNGLTLPAPPLRSRKHSERREGIEGAEVLAKKSLPFRLTFLSHNSPNADKPLLPVFLSQTVLTDTLAAGGAVHEPPVARVQCGMEPRAPRDWYRRQGCRRDAWQCPAPRRTRPWPAHRSRGGH